MTLLGPFLPQNIRYASNLFPDVEPFSIRSGASYEEIQYSIVTWIRDQLVPYLTENDPAGVWDASATALEDAVNTALAAQTDAFNTVFGSQFTGSMSAPPPTGDPTVDTPALQNAITAAQTAGYDLRITPSNGGTVKNYKLNQPLTWSLSRGSLIGTGHVGLDFSAMSSSYSGPALTVSGEGGEFTDGAHLSALHRVEGFRMIGHNTDSSVMDGILVADPLGNVDQGQFRSMLVYGFRDNLTFGANVWSIDFLKCAFANAHRYGVNLGDGTNAGECISFTSSSVYGSTNAGKTAAAIYAPAAANIDFRMFGGSLDYNDTEGRIEGGALTFNATHIEDNGVGAMFTYTQSTAVINVSFRDCDWDSANVGARSYLHQILAGSGSKITLTFDGDKGGMNNPVGCEWLHDSSGNESGDWGITATMRGHRINNGPLLGQPLSLLANGDFEASSSFASTPYGGWAIPGVGTWSIGAGGQPGAALKLIAATTATNYTATQRIRLPGDRRPIRFGGKMQVTACTAGNVQIGVQFYAEDGTTALGGALRIGNTVNTVDASTWWLQARTILPPKGAMYAVVQLTGGQFVGTALWDQIEAVPV